MFLDGVLCWTHQAETNSNRCSDDNCQHAAVKTADENDSRVQYASEYENGQHQQLDSEQPAHVLQYGIDVVCDLNSLHCFIVRLHADGAYCGGVLLKVLMFYKTSKA